MLSQRLLSAVRSFAEHRRFRHNIITLSSGRPMKQSQGIGFRKVPHGIPNGADVSYNPKNNSQDPMLSPSLYRSGNSCQQAEGIKLLKQVENSFKGPTSQRQRYLDIGCGTGNLTREILLHHGGDSSEMVGVDISSGMIELAREHSPHLRLSYDVLDIEMGDASGFANKHGKFDRVYSFFCLNWVRDKLRAFQNIAVLLRDDGQLLLAFVVRTDLREVWLDIGKLPRWKYYTSSWDNFIASHLNYRNPDAAIQYARKALREATLVPETCQVRTRRFYFDTKQALMDQVVPVLPVVHSQMPDEEKEDFYDDVYDVLSKHFSLGSTKFSFSMDICVVQGYKA